MNTYIDLSHSIENGMTYFPGDPEPLVVPANISLPWRSTQLHITTHTGTHIDAASHFIPHGKTIDQYLPERFLLSGIVVPAPISHDDEVMGIEIFAPYHAMLPQHGAVLIHTGWDRYWKSARYLSHPYLSPEAAQFFIDNEVTLVGIDALSVDSTAQGTDHAHAILLGNDILIVENLTRLDQLTLDVVHQFSFLPLALPGRDGSPVRAIAQVNG